jgi:hypothetical protein
MSRFSSALFSTPITAAVASSVCGRDLRSLPTGVDFGSSSLEVCVRLCRFLT